MENFELPEILVNVFSFNTISNSKVTEPSEEVDPTSGDNMGGWA